MIRTLNAEETLALETTVNLAFWPESVRFNPKREMDLPRLVVPMFGPVSSAYMADPYDPAGTAD